MEDKSHLTEEEWQAFEACKDKAPSQVALALHKRVGVRPQVVANQVDCWQRLKVKVPSWAHMSNFRLTFPTSLALQQCSSEPMARWRRTLVEGTSLIDLTGGLGVDCYFMSQGLQRVTYVEANEELCRAVGRNFSLLEAQNITTVNSTAEEVLAHNLTAGAHYDTLFIDPSRRDSHGGRVFMLQDCSPNVIELAEQMLALANVVIIKLSTLLDISMVVGALPNITDVFVTEISGECKDLIIKLKRYKETNSKVLFHSVMVHNDGTADEMKYEVEEEKKAADLLVYGDPKESMYLFEPSPSLMKLGPYKLISQRFGVNPIASSTHVYISADDVLEFLGRRFEIELVTDMSKKGIASVKGLYSRASVVVRNFPLKADELRKRLGLKESSENYVYGVTTSQGTHKLICCKRVG